MADYRFSFMNLNKIESPNWMAPEGKILFIKVNNNLIIINFNYLFIIMVSTTCELCSINSCVFLLLSVILEFACYWKAQ